MSVPVVVSRRRLLLIITSMATPVILASISQTLMGLVDTLMVARLGEAALAAVGVATLLFSAVAMSIKSIDVATQTFTARRIGQGRDVEVGATVTTALSVAVAAGCVFMLLGLVWPQSLMCLVNDHDDVQQLGVQYLRLRYLGMIPLLVFFICKAMFDGIGWTRVGMLVGVGMNLLNVGLNWVLIFGKLGVPALGVGGAALASTLSAAAAALVIVLIALRTGTRKRFRLVCRSNFQPQLLRPFLAIAWPPALQTFGNLLAVLIFFKILGLVSTLAVATGTIVLRIASLSFMPGFGIGAAVQTLVGQALGRVDVPAARRSAWYGVGLAVVFMGSFGVVFTFWPAFVMKVFSPDEAVVLAGIPVLRLLGLVQIIDAIGLTLAGALRGAGDTRRVMWVDIILGFGMLPGMTWLFALVLGWGLMGAFLGLLVWFTLFAVAMTWMFIRGSWEDIKL